MRLSLIIFSEEKVNDKKEDTMKVIKKIKLMN